MHFLYKTYTIYGQTSNWFDTKINWGDLRINWMFFAKSIGTSFLFEQLYEMVYKSYVGHNSITNYSNVMKTHGILHSIFDSFIVAFIIITTVQHRN